MCIQRRLLPDAEIVAVTNDGGRIINISSGLARFTIPGTSVYGAATGAVEVLTR
jgi:NAD(P)-dependent dehydrogenase (short-subunit alcohol dehydrogenase family)